MAGSDRRVVITGYGAMTPLGGDVASTFDAAREGRSGIDVVRRFDPEKLPCRIAGEIEDEWLASQENGGGRRLDKFSTRGVRMMRVAVSQAARAARLGEVPERKRVGVALGSHGDSTPGRRIAPHLSLLEARGWRPPAGRVGHQGTQKPRRL